MKYDRYLTVKIQDEMKSSIDKLLNELPREEYSTQCQLVRELIEIGLKAMWKKVNRANSKVEE